MRKVSVIILRTAGTNCDMETAFAFEKVGAKTELVHINELKKRRKKLSDFHILVIPGGFTYGDDIASGKVLANEIKYNLWQDIEEFVSSGRLMLGICNGFQVFAKMGLLPDVTLTLNDSGRFEDRWCFLRHSADNVCVWTKGMPAMIYLPVAHGEGKFVPADSAVLDRLKKNRQIVFRYCDQRGNRSAYPANPNGSVDDIAGICDPSGRVLGMMPHPERYITRTQHPQWTRMRLSPDGHGLRLFKNGVDFIRKNIL